MNKTGIFFVTFKDHFTFKENFMNHTSTSLINLVKNEVKKNK